MKIRLVAWLLSARVFRAALLLGLAVRLVILWHSSSLGTGIVDEQHYRRLAENLLAGHGFAWGPDEPTSIRPPLYPALVAGVWSLTGHSLQAVRALQIGVALLTTWFVYGLGRRAFSSEVGRLAAVAYWLYPGAMFFNFLILTETVFTALLMAFLLITVILVQAARPTWWMALACGALLGLASLARSILTPVPVLLCPLLFIASHGRPARRLAVAMVAFVGFLAVVGPWAVRNTRLQQVVTLVDTMGGINLRMGNYEYTPDDRMWDAVSLTGEKSWVRGIDKDLPDINPTEGQKDKWAQGKAIRYMIANPGTTGRRALIKFADFWGLEREFIAGIQAGLFRPPTWFAVVASAAILVGFPLLALVAAAGLWCAPARDWRVQVLLLLPIVVITGLHTVVFGHSRYHAPLMPILAIYAAALAIEGVGRRAEWSRFATRGALCTAFVLSAIWVRQIVFVDGGRISRLFFAD